MKTPRARIALASVGIGIACLAIAWLAASGPLVVPEGERIPGRLVGDSDPRMRELLDALAGVERERLVVLDEREGQPIYALVARGEHVEATWRELRERVPRTGRWPVVVGGAGDVSVLLEMEEISGGSVPAILARASTTDAAVWLASRRAELEAEYASPRGPWPAPGDAPPATLMIGTDVLTGEPLSEVAIALVPSSDGTEAPAWLTFGDYNECPPPAVHVAVLRRWRDRYGAELYGLTGELLQVVVDRPPSERASAIALAEEQYAYDADIVNQGTSSIDVLAATLLNARVWFFWWD